MYEVAEKERRPMAGVRNYGKGWVDCYVLRAPIWLIYGHSGLLCCLNY